jgi:hypothetical protein
MMISYTVFFFQSISNMETLMLIEDIIVVALQ